jgi:glycosyltransferase involved in cell wall biosynthesis
VTTLARGETPSAIRPQSRADAVAVVIPCFNAERTLAETLNSVIGQEGVAEIVVVDDGSTDGSLEIARGFEPGIRVLSGPNRGASTARNRGVAETSSEWVLFLDADDLLEPGTVEARLAAVEAAQGRGGADVVICDWRELHDDGGSRERGDERTLDWRAMRADAELATATHAWATTSAILYRRSVVEGIGGFRPDLPVIQDARFLFDAAFVGARFIHAPHVGASYRIIDGSLSRRNPASFWADVLLNAQQIEAGWSQRASLSSERKAAVFGIYDQAARGLFAANDRRYFAAIEEMRRLDLPMPLHARIAAPLARGLGMRVARRLLKWMGSS